MISTHILDTSKGVPVENILVKLQLHEGNGWKDVSQGKTNSDGRFIFDDQGQAGVYQLIFQIEDYFKADKRDSFFKDIPVVFKIENTQRKYHIPLLLSPFGYSTYRGS